MLDKIGLLLVMCLFAAITAGVVFASALLGIGVSEVILPY